MATTYYIPRFYGTPRHATPVNCHVMPPLYQTHSFSAHEAAAESELIPKSVPSIALL